MFVVLSDGCVTLGLMDESYLCLFRTQALLLYLFSISRILIPRIFFSPNPYSRKLC